MPAPRVALAPFAHFDLTWYWIVRVPFLSLVTS